jgi:hypothetical protein
MRKNVILYVHESVTVDVLEPRAAPWIAVPDAVLEP